MDQGTDCLGTAWVSVRDYSSKRLMDSQGIFLKHLIWTSTYTIWSFWLFGIDICW